MIKDALEKYVEAFCSMNHPPLLEMFILRNGVVMNGAARPKGVRKRADKMCFMNAAQIHWKTGFDYYEGFAASARIGLPIHHAWNAKNGVIVDTTWKEPESSSYMGVLIPGNVLGAELAKTGHYGVLSDGIMYNIDFIFRIDPGLRSEYERLSGRKL